jgi:hypothetical protein
MIETESISLPPKPALSVAEEDALQQELSSLRQQHSTITTRIREIVSHLGGRPFKSGATRPLWGPCTRCNYTWLGNWPHTIPRGCPRCGSTGWRVPPGDRKNARKPGDPPGRRWKGRRMQDTPPKRKFPARRQRIASFAGVEEMRLTPPPKPPVIEKPSLVPAQSVRFADPHLQEPLQPERSVSRPADNININIREEEKLIELVEGDGFIQPDGDENEQS